MTLPRLILLLALAASLPAQVDRNARPRRAERSRDYDVLHYRIQLEFNESARSLHGQAAITLRPLRDGFKTLVLDAETFRVTSAGALRFDQTPGKLTVHLDRPYRFAEELTVTISYQADQVAIDPERYGMPKGYGLGISFKSETPTHPRLIHTLSFPEGARHWFPCYDHPNDKATSELIATVDARYQVIANGVLLSVQEDSAKREKTFHWRQNQPHSTYLFAFAAGPYVQVRDTKGTLPISYWVYPKDVAGAERSFGKTRDIIEFFNRELGYTYPWPKYDQITIPDFGGGAESTNATVIGDNSIHDARAEQDFPTHWLVAHEAAHQWWGDLVTMRDWPHTWLNESFATYYEYVYMKHLLGEDEGAFNLLGKKLAYFTEARKRYMRPIVLDRWDWPNDNFDRHTYQKGGVVLAMLRSLMGDEPYRRSITHYLKKHAFGSVDTHDFQVAIREASGQVLDWFFEQWIFRAGHPVLEVSYTWQPGTIELRVVQKQSQPFAMPVSIGITTAAGKQLHPLWLRKSDETFSIPSAGRPLLVHFDEEEVLLKEITFAKSKPELLYQLTHDNAIGRIDAAAALKSLLPDEQVAAALRGTAEKDPFWAVRREAIFQGRAEFLRTRAAQDRSSAVRVAALAALGERKDASLAPFFEERFRVDDSYLAQAEAVRALGKLGGHDALLRKAAAMKSPHDVVAIAAREALAR
ncbi:MAG: HEAT repeat domain-containing protein [Acidobacteria bacterium]|nr:HEAT repeat domain-containing protein [Acidobacteriota bacterium]